MGVDAAVSTAASWSDPLVRYGFEMLTHALIHLLYRPFGRGQMAQRVQQHEIMNRAVVANRVDVYARLFQLSRVCLALVAQGIVLRGDDEGGGQALELINAGAKRRHIRIVTGSCLGSIEVPTIFHESTRQKSARAVLLIGRRIDAGVGRRNKEHLVADLGSLAVLAYQSKCGSHVAAD